MGRGIAILLTVSLAGNTFAPALGQPPRGTPPAHPSLPPDIQQGLEVAVMLSEAIGLYENEEWQVRLATVGYRVAATNGGEMLAYNFQILDLPEPNAMALPGGFLFLTRGVLEIGLTDDELAHLIGHEIAHVQREHFARSSRLSTLFTVLQTALMVGILIGTSDSGYRPQRVDVSEDPGRQDWSVGMTGKEALLEGSSLLGSVMRALFERGFSRKLEFEADETGDRLAVRAGYDPAGGPGLLMKLHERSYEGNRFSYWRTHPYFDQRITRSASRAQRMRLPQSVPDNAEFRQRLAVSFAAMADRVPDEKAALYLYRCALQAEPSHLASASVALQMVRYKASRDERQHPLRRRYGPLIADYDSVISHAALAEPHWDDLEQAKAERATLAERRAEVLPEYLELIEGTEASTDFLQRFLINFPDHEQAEEITCVLGLHYQLSGRADDAVGLLQPFLTSGPEPVWADSARTILQHAIGEIKDLTVCYGLLDALERGGPAPDNAPLIAAAQERMDELAATDLTLKEGGRFLQRYPDTAWSARVRAKTARRAQEMLERGRVQEGLHRYQDALDAFFAVLALAPESPAAGGAEEGIARINRLEAD